MGESRGKEAAIIDSQSEEAASQEPTILDAAILEPQIRKPDEPTRSRPLRKSAVRRLCFALSRVVLFVILCLGALYFAVENGYFDAALNREARTLLDRAAGQGRYKADVQETVLRFSHRGQLILDVHGLTLYPQDGDSEAFRTDKARIALNILPLLAGHLSISSITIGGAGINLDAMKAEAEKRSALRVDAIPSALEMAFQGLDTLDGAALQAGTRKLKVSDINFDLPAQQHRQAHVAIEELTLERLADGNLAISGQMTVEGVPATLSGFARKSGGKIDSFSIALNGFNVTPFLAVLSRQSEPVMGMTGGLDVTVQANRDQSGKPAALTLNGNLEKAAFYGEAQAAPVTNSKFVAHYDFAANKIEVDPSVLEFSNTRIPFNGGFIDADRLSGKDKNGQATDQDANTGTNSAIDPATGQLEGQVEDQAGDQVAGQVTSPGTGKAPRRGVGKGIGIDLLVQDAVAAPENLGDKPVGFSGQIYGAFDPDTMVLSAQDILIATSRGVLGGSLTVKFDEPSAPGMTGESPEISLGLFSEKIDADAVRAIWPFWFGGPARSWVYGNLFGGTLTNGSLALFLPAGRLPVAPEDHVSLNEKELKIRFDIAGTRISLAGDIPPIRDTEGHFELAGNKIEATVKKAVAYFPSGRTVDVSDSRLTIADVDQKPVIADVESRSSGNADALAELATYRPINALKITGYEPQDFSGKASVSLKARFPLDTIDTAPRPDWVAQIKLDDVAIAKPINGKKIAGLNGTMKVNPLSADLEADLTADSVPLHITMVEPLSPQSRQKRQRHVTASLPTDKLVKFAPGVDDIMSGNVDLDMELLDNGSQSVRADLTKATVSIPWAGWEKGAGVPAVVTFVSALNEGAYNISNFTFSGDGFGASGSLRADKGGLISAQFSKVKLAPTDNVTMNVMRSAGGYKITANGKSADIRGLLNKIKSASAGGESSNLDVSVSAKLDMVTGFNNEIMKNVDAVYAVKNGKPVAVKLTAVTGNDQAVVAKLSADVGGKRSIELTATDAGAFARFAGFYQNMQGGLLNLRIGYVSDGVWRGTADIRKFQLLNEQRLQKIVSTPAGEGGKSLNDAVKRDIDVSSQKFSRGYARILIDGDTVRIENGVVRGEQVGATFQGILRDGNNQTNMTGTFMPAYGLNRLFAELPFIGFLLGNGTDRGLIGITFRLAGPYDKPNLQINPLSLIAPGVFRNIFEFQ